MYSLDLKYYCDSYKLSFPDFNTVIEPAGYRSIVSWYNREICSGLNFEDEEHAIVSSITSLFNWLSYEKNFIEIMKIQKDHISIDK